MDSPFGLSARPEIIVDNQGFRLADPNAGSVVGLGVVPPPVKLVHALATNSQSGLTRRYWPSHPAGEVMTFGMDFAAVIPRGLGPTQGALTIFTNAVPPVDVSNTWIIDPVQIVDRALYATLNGGVDGADYQFRWTATDSNGMIYPRTALCLCSTTS
jgi:hypothetical protein